MHFQRKTSYEPDIRLFRHGEQLFWYGLLMLALIAAPLLLPTYYLSQLSFVCIFTIVGAALMLLAGFTGQISLGHAAFLGIGAYTESIMQARGIPFFISLPSAMGLSALAGVAIGLPALRMSGIYLAVATMAFGFIVEEVLTRWDSVTLGNNGMAVAPLSLFGISLKDEWQIYGVCLAAALLSMLVLRNLMRSPTGRAFVAIRDSEISAQSMGIHLARYKTKAFAISAALTGLAGALYAHKVKFLSPDQFGIVLSVEMMMMVIVGGMGSLHGAVFGAIFLVGLPQLVVALKDQLPSDIAQRTGLELTAFGLVLLLFVLFEPMGIYGRWLKVRLFLETFPLYRKGTFKRQKSFTKSDRLR
jgi:branched-chain amino acid transport system permease protein